MVITYQQKDPAYLLLAPNWRSNAGVFFLGKWGKIRKGIANSIRWKFVSTILLAKCFEIIKNVVSSALKCKHIHLFVNF